MASRRLQFPIPNMSNFRLSNRWSNTCKVQTYAPPIAPPQQVLTGLWTVSWARYSTPPTPQYPVCTPVRVPKHDWRIFPQTSFSLLSKFVHKYVYTKNSVRERIGNISTLFGSVIIPFQLGPISDDFYVRAVFKGILFDF